MTVATEAKLAGELKRLHQGSLGVSGVSISETADAHGSAVLVSIVVEAPAGRAWNADDFLMLRRNARALVHQVLGDTPFRLLYEPQVSAAEVADEPTRLGDKSDSQAS